jgi:hypothetical protein
VLAVVGGGELITLSDVMASMRFGLVQGVPADRDRVRATLDLLIERQLQLIEADRYPPPEPPDAAIEARSPRFAVVSTATPTSTRRSWRPV